MRWLLQQLGWLVAVIALGLRSGAAEVQDHPSHQVARISPEEARTAAEVSIAINPTNVDNLVAAAIMRGYEPHPKKPNYAFASWDAGQSWTTIPTANPDDRTQGDDVVVFSSEGRVVHGYICFVGAWGKATRSANGIFTTFSDDGGQTWGDPVTVVDHLNTGSPMEDKPWFVFDRSSESEHRGNLYASWTRFDKYGSRDPQDTSQIMFARSTDGGSSFTPAIRISDAGGDCVDDDNTVEGATPCVGPDGTIYVIWAGPRGMEFDKSSDGGVTFGSDRVISDLPGGWASDVEGINRHNGMPVTGVDLSNGPKRGALYVNWIDERNGDKDVFLMRSDDGGEHWGEPVRVNDDDSARDQFFTWMAVDPVDGSVNVAFYDRRATEGTSTRLTLARSVDGGQTFRNLDVDGMAEFECQKKVFFGDYIGIDAYGGRVAIAFMHFTGPGRLAISSAVYDFVPGTLEVR